MNPAALNNAAQALNTAALNPAALLSGKKDQINFYIPKLPRGIVAADEQRFLTDMHLLYFYSSQQNITKYSFCILCFLPKTCLPCLASPRPNSSYSFSRFSCQLGGYIHTYHKPKTKVQILHLTFNFEMSANVPHLFIADIHT